MVEVTHAAWMHILVTTNGYTGNEDLSHGYIIVSSLGGPGGERGELRKGDLPGFDGMLRLAQLVAYFSK